MLINKKKRILAKLSKGLTVLMGKLRPQARDGQVWEAGFTGTVPQDSLSGLDTTPDAVSLLRFQMPGRGM